MPCCEVITRTFVNEATTTIAVNSATPTVTISYLIDGEWTLGVSYVAKLVLGNLIIDHGGSSTGVIKVIM